jgi:hypothetical protein
MFNIFQYTEIIYFKDILHQKSLLAYSTILEDLENIITIVYISNYSNFNHLLLNHDIIFITVFFINFFLYYIFF